MQATCERGSQTSLFDIGRADAHAKLAKTWVRDHHADWLWMCDRAASYSARGLRFSVRSMARERGFVVDSRVAAPLARMLKAAVPQCARYIDTRGSVFDL